MPSIELNVRNMTCGSCVNHATQALNAVAGVTGVQVDLARGRVQVQTAAAADSTPALVAALNAAGYPAAPLDSAASGCAGASKGSGHGGSKGCCCGH